MSVAALRQQLAVLVAPPRAGTAAVPTGIAALDQALSDGGLPCGRLTEILGRRGSGRTTLTRQLVAGAVAAGRWVAYVDGTRTLSPRDWTAIAGTRRLWIIRPPNADRGAWCADVLLRSGAFGLVVLDGGPSLPRPVALRLTRLAQDHNAALVVVGDGSATVGSAVRLKVQRGRRPEAGGQRRGVHQIPPPDSRSPAGGSSGLWPRASGLSVLRIVVEKGGRPQSVEVCCAIEVARRLCAHSEVPDRRGVASRNRWGQKRVQSPESGVQRRPEERAGDSSRLRTPDSGLVVSGGCRR